MRVFPVFDECLLQVRDGSVVREPVCRSVDGRDWLVEIVGSPLEIFTERDVVAEYDPGARWSINKSTRGGLSLLVAEVYGRVPTKCPVLGLPLVMES